MLPWVETLMLSLQLQRMSLRRRLIRPDLLVVQSQFCTGMCLSCLELGSSTELHAIRLDLMPEEYYPKGICHALYQHHPVLNLAATLQILPLPLQLDFSNKLSK